jgi:hypothetical protein
MTVFPAPTVEAQASEALLTVAKTESLSAVGMRLITEQEYGRLQKEVYRNLICATLPKEI